MESCVRWEKPGVKSPVSGGGSVDGRPIPAREGGLNLRDQPVGINLPGEAQNGALGTNSILAELSDAVGRRLFEVRQVSFRGTAPGIRIAAAGQFDHDLFLRIVFDRQQRLLGSRDDRLEEFLFQSGRPDELAVQLEDRWQVVAQARTVKSHLVGGDGLVPLDSEVIERV